MDAERARSARTSRALLAMLAVTVIWGWAFVWMKQGLDAGDRWLRAEAPDAARGGRYEHFGLLATIGAFMALRFGAAAVLLPLCSRSARERLDAASWRGGVVLGGLLLAGFFLQMFGLHSVSSSVSAFLTSLYVLFTAAITAALARRAPRPELLLGAVVATLGAAWIGGPPQIAFGRGEWLTVACALVFAAHIVLTDRITRRVDPLAVTLTSFVVVAAGSAALGAIGFLSGRAPALARTTALLADPEFAWPLALAAVLATLLAIAIMNVFQRELDPVRAAIVYAIEPVWAAAIAILLGHEQPTRWLWIGGGALLAGNWIAELRLSRRGERLSSSR